MADKKKELDPKTETPEFLYQLTQKFMLGYIQQPSIPKEKQQEFARLCLDNKKEITRGKASFTVLDPAPVRKWFAGEFFPELLKKKKTKSEPSFFDQIEALLKD